MARAPATIHDTAMRLLDPPRRPAWPRAVDVAWRLAANHGGGYSYRLCKAGGPVSEACFQRTVLRFAGEQQWVQYDDFVQYGKVVPGPRVAIPLTKVSQGTYPEGSEWARDPIPGCLLCDQADCMPNRTWAEQQHCSQ
eukprot:gene51422-49042_t